MNALIGKRKKQEKSSLYLQLVTISYANLPKVETALCEYCSLHLSGLSQDKMKDLTYTNFHFLIKPFRNIEKDLKSGK
jgi:hypothetical protein